MDNIKKNKLPEEWIERIFQRFEEIYKKAWTTPRSPSTTMYAAFLKDEWSRTLKELTAEEIRKGIQECKDHSINPPTKEEFYKFCKGLPKDAIIQEEKSQTAREHLEDIKKKLGIKDKQT
jgi:hypothetical protein